jgi:hypothetical protein
LKTWLIFAIISIIIIIIISLFDYLTFI